jgi:hypothetical protein
MVTSATTMASTKPPVARNSRVPSFGFPARCGWRRVAQAMATPRTVSIQSPAALLRRRCTCMSTVEFDVGLRRHTVQKTGSPCAPSRSSSVRSSELGGRATRAAHMHAMRALIE